MAFAGPVCVMGTTLSVFGGLRDFFGAVTVKIPSDDNDDTTSLMSCSWGRTYRLTKCLEMNPCSSCFSSCLPSTTMLFPVVFTVISLGANCWTSKITWNLSLSCVMVEPESCRASVGARQGLK